VCLAVGFKEGVLNKMNYPRPSSAARLWETARKKATRSVRVHLASCSSKRARSNADADTYAATGSTSAARPAKEGVARDECIDVAALPTLPLLLPTLLVEDRLDLALLWRLDLISSSLRSETPGAAKNGDGLREGDCTGVCGFGLRDGDCASVCLFGDLCPDLDPSVLESRYPGFANKFGGIAALST
jgi:hypothetical protein